MQHLEKAVINGYILFSASEPYLYLQVNLKPFGETNECESDWEPNVQHVASRTDLGFTYKTPRLPGIIMNKVKEKHIYLLSDLKY